MAGNMNASNETRTITVSYSGGGGGGGGGGGSSSSLPSQSLSISLATGATATIIFTKDFGITNISITAKTAASGVLKVEKVKEPALRAIAAWKGGVYKYLQITAFPNEKIAKAIIKFKIPKSWLNSYDEDKVALMHLTTKWEPLLTNKTSSDSSYVYYSAETTGFSLFAITAETKTLSIATKAEEPIQNITEETNVTEPVQEDTKQEIQNETNFLEELKEEKSRGWILIGLGVIIIIISIIYLNKKK